MLLFRYVAAFVCRPQHRQIINELDTYFFYTSNEMADKSFFSDFMSIQSDLLRKSSSSGFVKFFVVKINKMHEIKRRIMIQWKKSKNRKKRTVLKSERLDWETQKSEVEYVI